MLRNKRLFFEIILPFLVLFVYCEYFRNYLVLNECYWPILKSQNEDFIIGETKENPLQILVITDIHLLGPRRGVWIERVIREWKMSNAFHTLISLLQPEMIFILGDTMDEGLYLNPEVFEEHTRRFNKLFSVPKETKLHIVVGNHDIGFHYEIGKQKNDLFMSDFKSPSIQLITEKGNHFVLVNSMAMEGDNCFLCKPAMEKLSEIEKILKCARGSSEYCELNATIKSYSRPILMQHFPLYRPSDMECNDSDAAPFPLKAEIFKEAWDCLSKNATFQLLRQIEPRLSLSGHTHYGCTKNLPIGNGVEITIPSFNWRNKNNPAVGLGVFTPNNYAFVRCPLPQESTTIILYITGSTLILFWLLYRIFKSRRRNNFKYILG